jgi:multiple sugar transport system ATP-binding protein
MASVTYDKARRICPGADRPAVDALDLDITGGEFLVRPPAALMSS